MIGWSRDFWNELCGNWVLRISMTCIRTVSYSILINGKPHGKIHPTQGLRQGDPLSPYFFLLCAEGLSTIIERSQREGLIIALPVTKGNKIESSLFCG
jgi:hypothetical protein